MNSIETTLRSTRHMLIIQPNAPDETGTIEIVFPSEWQTQKIMAWWNSLRLGAQISFELRDYAPDTILPNEVVAGRVFWTPPLKGVDADASSACSRGVRQG
jgi:hypothetical protein